MPPILLLHLSDLHFGPHSRFHGGKPEKLGKSFHRSLAEAQKRLPIDAKKKVDLVFVTGDFAEAGKKLEFAQGRAFLEGLAGELGLLPQKFVFVPGNHDVNWDACRAAFYTAQMDGEPTEAQIRAALDRAKFKFYDEFLANFYGKDDPREPIERGAFLYRFEELQLAVAALNSCEKESHRDSDHVGEVSEEQAQAVLDALKRPDFKGWFKVLAVHHNPVGTTPANLGALLQELEKGAEDQRLVWLKILAAATSAGKTDEAKLGLWRNALAERAFDPHLFGRFVSDAFGFDGRRRLKSIVEDARPQLILHGHHHAKDEDALRWKANGFAHVLSAGSLWLRPDKLPENEPASARLILLDPEVPEIRAWSLVFSERARNEGEVGFGAFTLDAAEQDGYQQRLDLPEGFEIQPRRKRSAKKVKVSVDSEFLAAFRLRFADQYAPWDLGSLGAMRPGGVHEAKEARLDDMYLELRFDPNLNPEKMEEGKPLRSADLLSRDRPLALTGVAGAGKTTWARYTFRQLVRDEHALPLMLVLRDVARRWQEPGTKEEEHSIDAALDGWIGAQMGLGWTRRLGAILKATEGPRPILLVDGWDELGPLGEKFRDKLMGFLREHPRAVAVVTSRPYGEQKPTHAEGFEKLEVQPLSDSDIEEMTRRFFGRFSGTESAKQQAELFLSALERSQDTRSLARTPLLLTMMLLVGYSKPLPDKRHLLYAQCIDTLLHDRPEQKAAEGAMAGRHTSCPSGLEQRRRWTAALAYQAQTKGYEELRTQRGRVPVVRSWKELAEFLPDECPTDRERNGFIAWLVEVAGLLVERTDESLSFTHLSFQEYLTAYHLATTAADHDQRLTAFQSRVGQTHWWETLRLLAAQMDGSNPGFLGIALRALFEDEEAADGTHSFLGTVLADGLGQEDLFQDWSRKYPFLFSPSGPAGVDLCARAWLGTRQEKRRISLARGFSAYALSQNWLDRVRYGEFVKGWSQIGDVPERASARGIEGALANEREKPSREEVASGRIFAGAFPLWPERFGIGWLHLWPGHRRLAGLRLQSAVAAGAPRKSLVALARHVLLRPFEDENSRRLARNLARKLIREFNRDWAGFRTVGLDLGEVRHQIRDVVRDQARELVRNWDRDGARYRALVWHNDLVILIREESITFFDRRHSAVSVIRSWARDLARGTARSAARDWSCILGLKEVPTWLETFALTEASSLGRSRPRTLLAWDQPSKNVRRNFLAEASRQSLDSKRKPKLDLTRDPKGVAPLWPALARHVARISTPEDKARLEKLAQTGGEGLPKPLCWGLQFIVRGDVLLDDGSIITLDELAREAGVDPLPYLEDIAPELEVDWDVDDEEPIKL